MTCSMSLTSDFVSYKEKAQFTRPKLKLTKNKIKKLNSVETMWLENNFHFNFLLFLLSVY